MRLTDLERYLSKCAPPDENGCRLWMAGRGRKGYGKFNTGRAGRQTTWTASRYGYAHLVGPIPDGYFVLHTCDVPACQTPEHWFLGTHQDNMDDMAAKGRRAPVPRGRTVKGSKLTEGEVRAIRTTYGAGGVSQRALARLYGVTQGSIYDIIHRRNWAWLD